MPWSPIQMVTSLMDPLYWGVAWSVDTFLSEVIYKHVSGYQWQATHLLLRRSRAVWKLRGKTSDLLLCSWRLRAHLGFAGITCPGSSWSLTLAGSGVTWKSDRSQEHWHLLVWRNHPALLLLWWQMEKLKHFTGEKSLNSYSRYWNSLISRFEVDVQGWMAASVLACSRLHIPAVGRAGAVPW